MSEGMTRAEYQDMLEKLEEQEELITRAGFIRRSRKAFVGAITTAAAILGPLILDSTRDGSISLSDIGQLAVIGAGAAIVGFLGVWAVPNAE